MLKKFWKQFTIKILIRKLTAETEGQMLEFIAYKSILYGIILISPCHEFICQSATKNKTFDSTYITSPISKHPVIEFFAHIFIQFYFYFSLW